MARVPDSLKRDLGLPRFVPNFLPRPVQDPEFPLINVPNTNFETQISRDSLGNFEVRRSFYGVEYFAPVRYNFEAFAKAQRQSNLRANWGNIIASQDAKGQNRGGLLDFKINIPGGRKSAFTTIFGKPQVNLSVTGQANMNVGVTIQDTKNGALPRSQQKRADPTFEQNLQLNIQGTIGDKLTIKADWDTERAFDYQNRLSIVYQGYEDEIIKRIELGNVTMETGNSLIRGGGALFGIKTVAELGPVRVTTVLSQQEGQSNSETISSGSQESQLSIRPAEYQFDQHFFLDFFLRQEFETAMENPNQIVLPLQNISNVRIYKRIITNGQNNDGVKAVALADMGIVQNGNQFAAPNNNGDSIDENLLNQLRDRDNLTAGDLGVATEDFVFDSFQQLQVGIDYEINTALGFISFKQRLNNQEVVAVSFDYEVSTPQGNQVVRVGELPAPGSDDIIFLKMLRPAIPNATNRLWDLMLKNIYFVGATNLKPDDVDLRVFYTGEPPEDQVLKFNGNVFGPVLLRGLGLDRLGPNNVPTPDDVIDFGATFNGVSGQIIFPFLEPFGSRISSLIDEFADGNSETKEKLVFRNLYARLPSEAIQDNRNQAYVMKGTSKGGVESNFNLGFALVEGSVKVRAGGAVLVEGSDYIVDYAIGTIQIINQQYLASGSEIQIEYENNQLIQIQQKTFTGVRAEYQVAPNVNIGSTIFRLKERPLTDKIKVGDEPINNTVIGFDADAKFNAPWLTRAIDRVPLLQTKEPSSIEFSGEWAQIRPSVARTAAVSSQLKSGDFAPDEKAGISYIDDFEGVENNITFVNIGRWFLSSAPAGIPGFDTAFELGGPFATDFDSRLARNNLRAQLAWYTIPIVGLGGTSISAESEPLQIDQVFNRQTQQGEGALRTLDFYYNPSDRGPYNYNMDLRNVLDNRRRDMWGGLVATLPNNQENLNQNNMEFLEFWVQFVLPNGKEPTPADLAAYNGRMLIDIGQISEDVVPNAQFNSEDGLAAQGSKVIDGLGTSFVQANTAVFRDGAFDQNIIAEEDVGLDGVANGTGAPDREGVLFQDFVNQMRAQFADQPEKLTQIERDPSNDDFVYWNSAEAVNSTNFFHEQFYRFLGYHEGNSTVPGQQAFPRPDTEGLLSPSSFNPVDQYFEYELNINPADSSSLRVGRNFIVDQSKYGDAFYQSFYQIRVPLRDFIRRVGGIDNFNQITHFRVWLTGYDQPFTMRFATMEFVGSQWRKRPELSNNQANTNFDLFTINIEENQTRRPIPYILPPDAIRTQIRGQQNILANEQSLALGVENLPQGDLRMVSRVFSGGLNLINYSNMRLSVHGEGYNRRDDAFVVVRIGSDLENNYYEFRQPISPTDPNTSFFFPTTKDPLQDEQREFNQTEVWKPDENNVNIILSVFNILKQDRNARNVDPNVEFVRKVGELIPERASEVAEGARVVVKGNPSLRGINEIGLGILNPLELQSDGLPAEDIGTPSLNAEMWLNELRVTGFEDKKGWKANARTSVKMADFATLSANYNQSTDGFGSIDSRLGDRQRYEDRKIDLSTNINLHKFLPDRYGWNFPVKLDYSNTFRREIFLTQEADIRFTDFEQAVNQNEDLSGEEKQTIIDEKLEEIETVGNSFSFVMSNISKKFSKSPIAKYTLDKVRGRYSYSTSENRNPQTQKSLRWNYDTGLDYSLTFSQIKMWQPFGFLEEVPILSLLSRFKMGYYPSSISMSTGLRRSYSETRRRTFDNQPTAALQQTHDMNANTGFGFSYNFTPNIAINYSNRTSFNLQEAAIDTNRVSGIAADSSRFFLNSTFDTFDKIINESGVTAQRSNYGETYSFNWKPNLRRNKSLSWFDPSVSYSANFNWTNRNVGSGQGQDTNFGADVSNSGTLTNRISIKTRDLLDRVGFLKALKDADSAEERKRKAEADRKKRARAATNNATQNVPNRQRRVQPGEEPDPQVANEIKKNTRPQGISSPWRYHGRKLLLALTSFQNVDMTYTRRTAAQQGGFAGNAPIYLAFNSGSDSDFAPPLLYRMGFENKLPIDQLVFAPNRQVATNWSFDNSVQVSTGMRPFPNVNVDLSWNFSWNERNSITRTQTDGDVLQTLRGQNGTFSTSAWVFGNGIDDLLKKQFRAALDDIRQNETGGFEPDVSDELGNMDGRSVLLPSTVLSDFRESYLGAGNGSFGPKGFGSFPMPNWSISVQRLDQRLPFLQPYVKSLSLNHQYRGQFQSGFLFNPNFDTQSNNTRLGQFNIFLPFEEFAPNRITASRSFAPLISVNTQFHNNMRTEIGYETQKNISYSFSSSRIEESSSEGIKVGFNWEKRGFKFPFFGGRLKNTVRFTVTGGITRDENIKLNVGDILRRALDPNSEAFLAQDPTLVENQVENVQGQTRRQASLVIGYEFSRMVTASFNYNYQHTIPRSTTSFERIDQSLLFNIVININSR